MNTHSITCALLLAAACTGDGKELTVDPMYNVTEGGIPVLGGTHHTVFRGERDVSGYNNHAYLAHHAGRFWAIWSSSASDGAHTGQCVRFATSDDGRDWSDAGEVMPPPDEGYYIARGLWLHRGRLLALAARCTGETTQTEVAALETYQWRPDRDAWEPSGSIGAELINNYPPIQLPSGQWLMPYRKGELNRVDGVLLGGVEAVDCWRHIPIPSSTPDRFTEANAVVRADGSIGVHLRDNHREGYLFRSVSTDGGESFPEPVQTNFPDCKSKHYCFRLSDGMYILINNPDSRKTLRVSSSPDGKVFTSTAILRQNPPKVRNPGHDKSASYTYPHAIEHAGAVHIIYAVNRDDIGITRIRLNTIAETLGHR